VGDSLREAAFDVAYGILDDVGDAEDCASEALARANARWPNDGQVPEREAWVLDQAANVAMAKARRSPARQWRRVLVLGAGAAVLFLLAVGCVVAR